MRIENKFRKHNEAKTYYRVYIEMSDGERLPLLMTHREVLRAAERAGKNPEDTKG
jgi:hypothetical protein